MRLTAAEETLCATCNRHLPRTFFWNHPLDNEMTKTFWILTPVEKAAALFYYEPQSEASRIIYQMKYKGHPEIGEQLGRLAAEEMKEREFFEGIDLLLPVPLTHERERERGYNQSMEIAQGIHDVTGIPVSERSICRHTFTGSQTHKDRLSRKENVVNAFELLDPSELVGKHILLVDDVVTTGATLLACSQEVLKAQPRALSFFSLGYTR
jgi:ComF family protein